MKEYIRKNPALAAVLAAGIFLFLAAAFLPAAPVWITDVGNKYIVMRHFAEKGKVAVSHPETALFPTGGFHFKKTETGVRSFYPEQFPVAVSYFYRLMGPAGVTFLPILCGILLAGGAAHKFRSFSVGILTLLGTPCVFYSLQLWEMVPAVLAGFFGVMLLREKKFLTGGLVLGLGLFLREELYFLGASCGLVFLCQRQWKALIRLLAGFLSGMLPVWLLQWYLTGHVLGFHGSTYYLNNRSGFDLKNEICGIFWNYYQHLFRFEVARELIVPVVLLLLLALCRPTEKVQKTKLFVLAGSGILFLLGALRFNGEASLCYAAALSAGFISTLPLCWNFWCNWKQLLFSGRWQNRFLTGVVITYTLLVPPLLTRHDVGLFWGARHFLFVMPFAVYLAVKALKYMPFGAWLWRGLVGISLFWQLCGLGALSQVSEESVELTDAVRRARTTVTASDVFFLPEQAPELFFDQEFYEVADPVQLDLFLDTLRRRKIREFVFITSPRWARLNNAARQKLAAQVRVLDTQNFVSRGSGFMDLVILKLYLK